MKKKLFKNIILINSCFITSIFCLSVSSCAKEQPQPTPPIPPVPPTPSKDELFSINKNGALLGFNPALSEDEILEKIKGDALVIPDTVNFIADNAFWNSSRNSTTIPASVKHLDLTNAIKLKSFGSSCFRASPFTQLAIPPSVALINELAFSESALEEINFVKKETYQPCVIYSRAFYSCKQLNKIIFPVNFINVYDQAFAECENITTLDFSLYSSIPNWTGNNVFENSLADNCSINVNNEFLIVEMRNFMIEHKANQNVHFLAPALIYDITYASDGKCVLKGFAKNITPEQIVTYLGNKLIIPVCVTSINDYAFCKNSKTTIPEAIDELDLSNNVYLESIEVASFSYAPFKKIKINAEIEYVGEYAFSHSSVQHLEFKSSISKNASNKKIFKAAFYQTNLEYVKFSHDIQLIQPLAFGGCPHLTKLDLLDLDDNFDFSLWFAEGWQDSSATGKWFVRTQSQVSPFTKYFASALPQWESKVYFDSPSNIFNVNEMGTVIGFDSRITEEDIKTLCANQLTFSKTVSDVIWETKKNITSIGKNAFFKNGKSTIPSSIEKIRFNDNCNCQSVGASAFQDAPCIKIIEFCSTCALIEANAFANATQLESIDVSRIIDTSMLNWSNAAFSNVSSSGNIFIDNTEKVLDDFTKYFNGSGVFPMGDDNWKIISTKKWNSMIFDIDNDVLRGFHNDVELYPDSMRSTLFDICGGDDRALVIPNNIRTIREMAFYESRSDSSAIKNKYKINRLRFEEGSVCESIEEQAFYKLGDDGSGTDVSMEIQLPKTLNEMHYHSFGSTNLSVIDVSDWTFNIPPEHKFNISAFEGQKNTQGIVYVNSEDKIRHYQGWFIERGFDFTPGHWEMKVIEKK